MKNSRHDVKTRGYSRRTRPAGTRAPNAATTTTTITTTSNDNDNISNNEVVSIPIPSTISTDWVIRTAPTVLARHLMYVRGLWPMPASQLFLLLREGNSIRSGDGKNEETSLLSTATNATNDHDNMANKRRRVNIADTTKRTKTNPSLRRKQTRALDQITRLCDEHICSLAIFNGLHQNQQHKLPLFLLISLGSSYGKSRELYLLDFQSLIDNDNDNDNNETTTMTINATNNKNVTTAVSFAPSTNMTDGSTDRENHNINDNNCSHAKEQKLEATLTRKLLSALMNGEKSLTNSLPCKSSRTFRLFFTIGFITKRNDIDEVVGATADTVGNDDDDGKKFTGPYPIPDTSSEHTAFLSSPTTSWIPRKGFAMPKQKYSRSSTRNQSLVTIRFHRRQREQPRSRNEDDNDNDGARSSLVQPTSEKLTWMSLTTSVKGFGL